MNDKFKYYNQVNSNNGVKKSKFINQQALNYLFYLKNTNKLIL